MKFPNDLDFKLLLYIIFLDQKIAKCFTGTMTMGRTELRKVLVMIRSLTYLDKNVGHLVRNLLALDAESES